MGALMQGAAAVVAGFAILANIPTSLWMSSQKATLEYLAATTLTTLDESKRKFPVISTCTTFDLTVLHR